jgi:hypothetical protein
MAYGKIAFCFWTSFFGTWRKNLRLIVPKHRRRNSKGNFERNIVGMVGKQKDIIAEAKKLYSILENPVFWAGPESYCCA